MPRPAKQTKQQKAQTKAALDTLKTAIENYDGGSHRDKVLNAAEAAVKNNVDVKQVLELIKQSKKINDYYKADINLNLMLRCHSKMALTYPDMIGYVSSAIKAKMHPDNIHALIRASTLPVLDKSFIEKNMVTAGQIKASTPTVPTAPRVAPSRPNTGAVPSAQRPQAGQNPTEKAAASSPNVAASPDPVYASINLQDMQAAARQAPSPYDSALPAQPESPYGKVPSNSRRDLPPAPAQNQYSQLPIFTGGAAPAPAQPQQTVQSIKSAQVAGYNQALNKIANALKEGKPSEGSKQGILPGSDYQKIEKMMTDLVTSITDMAMRNNISNQLKAIVRDAKNIAGVDKSDFVSAIDSALVKKVNTPEVAYGKLPTNAQLDKAAAATKAPPLPKRAAPVRPGVPGNKPTTQMRPAAGTPTTPTAGRPLPPAL